jgi:hypothetical protein
VTSMTFHGPTRIKDAVAIAAHKSHCLCSICSYWTPGRSTCLHAMHPGNPGHVNAGGQQPNRGRGRGLGGGNQHPSQGTHQHAPNSRGRLPSRSPSRQCGLLKRELADRDRHKPFVNCGKKVAINKTNSRLKSEVAVHLARELNCMDVEVSRCLHECRMLHISFCINSKNRKSAETIKFWHASLLLARSPDAHWELT